MVTSSNIELPEKQFNLLRTGDDCILFGGRMWLKSSLVAQYLILESLREHRKGQRFLCAREYAVSISKSSKASIEKWIMVMGLAEHFSISNTTITAKETGVEFVFYGLQDTSSIKSLDALTIVWIEEGETLKERSKADVYNTAIRNDGAQMIITFNPRFEDDYSFTLISDVYEEAISAKGNTWCKSVENSIDIDGELITRKTHFMYGTYKSNKFLPKSALAEVEIKKQKSYEAYQHEFLGHLLINSEVKVFNGHWEIKEVDINPDSSDVLIGMDFGYLDPTTMIKSYIKDGYLCVFDELYQSNMTETDIYAYISSDHYATSGVPIVADSAAKMTIEGLKERGIRNIVSSKKGKDSISNGIQKIKDFKKVLIHPRCVNTIHEFASYSYKTHKTTGKILNEIIDDNNHAIDPIRYSLEDHKPQKLIIEAY